MSKYAETALKAASIARESELSPQEAWQQAVKHFFPDQIASQEKGCPRSTFLGLAEEGLITGIPKGDYVNSRKNKRHATDAVKLLTRDPSKATLKPEDLWKQLPEVEFSAAESGKTYKEHNSQMDVVLALWHAGLIES